jgi:hypothetical protein
LWIESFEFKAGVCGFEVPVDGFVARVSVVLPGGGFVEEGREVRDASSQALLCEDTQFNLGHMQPAAVFGREV